MKRAWALLLVTTLCATVAMGQAPRAADADPAKAMADLVAKTRGTLAIVEFSLTNELTNEPMQAVAGMAICVNAGGADKKATLITSVLGGEVLASSITSTQVYIPGVEKPLRGIYLATDPGSGITFVQVADPYDWKAVGFAEKANLSVGKPVYSVGVLDAWTGFEPYLGMAFVSAQLRVPGPLVYVTGGNLTNIGSPVFNADGTGIGIVFQQQLPNVVTLTGQGGAGGNVVVSSNRETTCFVPVDDFAYILKAPPLPGKRPSWTGITGFGTYPQALAPLPSPAVKVGKVIPNSPAAKAGLVEGDVILQLNGQNLEKLPTMDLVRMNLEQMMSRLPVEANVTLTLNGKPNPVKFKTEERPLTWRDAEKYYNKALGIVVREKVPLDEYLDASPVTSKEEGLYVVGVIKDTPAAKAGLVGGPELSLISTVNGKAIKKAAEFRGLIEAELAKPAHPAINLLVKQGTRSSTITIQP